ncbi:hypothetical protein FSP39_002030 [Pinctada imbricata]|uniref:PiggyBac transposable element-derived protein domain-containing protein n=1 Tax=Pinctada imbricata TaxID=66713 RepID=A0AA88YUP9_PINIB|nr:hypothetical protein FSP39_002030 [Pinctada imbricata]
MDSSDDSGSDFEGFAPEVVAAAEKKLLDLLELDPNDLSDVDLSDLDFESSDSEDENDDASTSNTNQNGDQWTDRLRRFTIEDFNGTPRPTTILPSDANEIDFFNLLFPSELLEKIAEETNRYAESEQEKKGQDPKWRATTAQEIRAYIGIQIVMGIIVAPNQDMYFSNDSLFKPSGINERITRDRLDKLNQYFHVSDNSQNPRRGQPGHDKLAHVRTIMDVILPKLKSAYNPHKEVSIDEAMIAFTGRLGFKQYVPLKPTKRGIKVWMRADPHNGFVNEFQVYTGKEGRTAEKGLGERVVRDLSRSIWGNYHHIYCDNYFTSIQLFNDLAENKTYACGTIRTNRKGLPPTITKSKLKKQGDVIQMQKGDMVATAWHDKRTVTLLSTNVDPTDTTEVQRKQKDGTIINVPCPRVLKIYTQFMNGVDRADQLRSTYSICRKASKWWKYLFWFMVDVCICNAFILMKESTNHVIKTKTGRTRERTQLEFRIKLAHQLLGDFWGKRKRESIGERQTQGLFHWPIEMDKKRTCKQCSKQKIRKEPKTGCEQCNVNLCVGCFKPYHQERHPELFN